MARIGLPAAMLAASVLAGATMLLAAPAGPPPAPSSDNIVLAPHRAFYELKLASSTGSRPISSIRGRIMYDFSGSPCEGYGLKFRQVSDLNSQEGNDALSDLSSTSWEDSSARKFTFQSENKLNQQTGDVVDGRAERGNDNVVVTLQKPDSKSFKIPANAVFPTEHMRKIIAAGRAGKKVLDLVIYDGSETGEKLYNTLTVIGRAIPPGNPPSDAANIPALNALTRWPVNISYFDRDAKAEASGEQTPVYSINFELYENGISRALKLNYADFSISGELSSLDIKKAKGCP